MTWEAIGTIGGILAAITFPLLGLLARVAWLLGAMKQKLETIDSTLSSVTGTMKAEHERLWGSHKELETKVNDHGERIAVIESQK